MGKEAKIGLVVVGVLAGALFGLLLKRFVLTGTPAVQTDAEQLASQPHAIPTHDKPTVVTAQKDSADPSAGGVAGNDWSTRRDDVPHGSFLPADDLAPNAGRYAEQDQPTPAAPGSDPSPSPAAARCR